MNLSSERVSPLRLASAVWKLLRLRIIIFISGFRRAKLRAKIVTIIITLAVLGFGGFIFFLSWMLLGFLRSPELATYVGDVSPFLEDIPGLLVAAAFIGIFLTSFGVLLQALYLSGDMDFLLASPLPIRAVFLSKLLQAILPNFTLICLFALPVLYGLGLGSKYSLPFFILVPIILASLALAAAGISALLVMLVVRIFPARRVAEVISFIGAISAFICSQSGQLANWVNISGNQTNQLMGLANRLNNPLLPFTWVGRGLVSLGEGNWFYGAGLILLTLVVSGGIFLGSLSAAENLYYTGWASIQSVRRRKKSTKVSTALPKVTTQRRSIFAQITSRIPSAIRAIINKDFLILRRDLRNLSQLVSPLIFGIIYTFMLVRNGGAAPAGRGEAPSWFMGSVQFLFAYGQVAIAMFVGWTLLARLGLIAFSHEGKSYWILKAAPLTSRQLLSSKFLVAYLPSLLLGWFFLLVIAFFQHNPISITWYTYPIVALSLAGLTGVELAFGVFGVRLDWQDPRHMNTGTAGCLSAVASMVYLVISLGLFILPLILLAIVKIPLLAGQLIGLGLGGSFSLFCAIFPLWLIRNRVPRMGEV